MPQYCYTKEVDAHIYLPQGCMCETQEDWVQLAVAALDQSGMSVENQKEVETFIRSKLSVVA